MKINKSFYYGLLSGAMIMLLLTVLYFSLVCSANNQSYYSNSWNNSEIKKVVTNLDYMDSVANRMNLENHVSIDIADKWESLSDREKINALLYNYTYEEILKVREHPNYTHRDILSARKKQQ